MEWGAGAKNSRKRANARTGRLQYVRGTNQRKWGRRNLEGDIKWRGADLE